MVTCKQPPKSLRMLVRSGNDQLCCLFLSHKKGNECTLLKTNSLSICTYRDAHSHAKHIRTWYLVRSLLIRMQYNNYVHCMYTKCITTVAWTSLEELANSDAQYHLIEWAEHNEL